MFVLQLEVILTSLQNVTPKWWTITIQQFNKHDENFYITKLRNQIYNPNSKRSTSSKRKMEQENIKFVNDLFDKLFSHVDTDMIDLHDSDCCDDHLQFEQLSLDF